MIGVLVLSMFMISRIKKIEDPEKKNVTLHL